LCIKSVLYFSTKSQNKRLLHCSDFSIFFDIMIYCVYVILFNNEGAWRSCVRLLHLPFSSFCLFTKPNNVLKSIISSFIIPNFFLFFYSNDFGFFFLFLSSTNMHITRSVVDSIHSLLHQNDTNLSKFSVSWIKKSETSQNLNEFSFLNEIMHTSCFACSLLNPLCILMNLNRTRREMLILKPLLSTPVEESFMIKIDKLLEFRINLRKFSFYEARALVSNNFQDNILFSLIEVNNPMKLDKCIFRLNFEWKQKFRNPFSEIVCESLLCKISWDLCLLS
jgi:hypothetical protein